MKTKDSKILKRKEKTVSSVKAPTKTIRNVSLQSWTIPTGREPYFLTPGSSVEVPVSNITERVITLQKRRLITVS